jgi:hypothetical protein
MKAGSDKRKSYDYEIKPPVIMPGVVPDKKQALVAMDSGEYGACYGYMRDAFSMGVAGIVGFPGYPYLAMLSTRAEYRAFAQSLATQITREWIVLNSTETAGDDTRQKCTELEQMITDLKLKEIVAKLVEHDSFYGRAQILHNIVGHDLTKPLILSEKTIKKQDFNEGTDIKKYYSVTAVEAMWTTPNAYNAIDPSKPDFYKPSSWWMLGQQVHSTRLQTVITREVMDMLKPAFNFGGMSMSQLAPHQAKRFGFVE